MFRRQSSFAAFLLESTGVKGVLGGETSEVAMSLVSVLSQVWWLLRGACLYVAEFTHPSICPLSSFSFFSSLRSLPSPFTQLHFFVDFFFSLCVCVCVCVRARAPNLIKLKRRLAWAVNETITDLQPDDFCFALI